MKHFKPLVFSCGVGRLGMGSSGTVLSQGGSYTRAHRLLQPGEWKKGGQALIQPLSCIQGHQGQRTKVGTGTGNVREAKVSLVAGPLHTNPICSP
jgi:hypothetical protein